MFRVIAAAAVLCLCAWAEGPAFEVATIKPAAPQEMGRMMVGMRGGPGTNDPGQATFTNMSLTGLVQVAWGVQDYQVTAPSWMDSTRFDVIVKVPAGASKEDFKAMMRNLLAERFKLAAHKESKEVPIYALVVGKNGAKLTESPKTAPADDETDGGRRPPGPPQRDKDGFPILRGGRGNLIFMGPNGRLQMVSGHVTMAEFARNLSGMLGRPVVDQTGIQGEYDLKLEYTREGLPMPRGMPAPPPGMMPPAEGGEAGPSIFTAVQERLGLKLDARKGPVDLIVVDSAEKTPTEN